MNLDQITSKCWILALFERDDGERLLLGDGWYDFKDSLQHFQPNNIASDVVELQGTDGQLLAGQVRRSASQNFDGYIGDALTSKAVIESRRKDFIQFFRVRRFYKVIYIFPDGSAIQRRRGYLTDAPSVPEMWQKFPEYHVAVNFEDVNYYEYSEDSEGEEVYANTALIDLLNLGIGGLVWDEDGAVSEPIPPSATKNVFNYDSPLTDYFLNSNGTWGTSAGIQFTLQSFRVEGGETLVFSFSQKIGSANLRIGQYNASGTFITRSLLNTNGATVTLNANCRKIILNAEKTSGRQFVEPQLEFGSTPTSYVPFGSPELLNGYVWEAGSESSTTTVEVSGIDNAEPIWTVTGPATNPTLTNITIGRAITWNGTVPAGQTLVVDMGEQTATLAGANVYQFISGSWITLRLGPNKLSYSATGGADQPSQLEWNGVVG